MVRLSVCFIAAAILTASAWALPTGMTGVTRMGTGTGCGNGCHSGSSLSITSISGPSQLNVGQTGTYTVTMTGGTLIGVDVAASSGSVKGVSSNLQVLNGEVTHTQKLTGTTIQFSFTPSAAGTATLYATAARNSKSGGWGHAPDFPVTVTSSGTASVAEGDAPNAYSLHQNYPNPFNPSTLISYSLPQEGSVQLRVYNLLGEEVAMLVHGTQTAGAHSIRFDGSGLPTGAYLYRLEVHPSSGAAPFIATRKFVLAR